MGRLATDETLNKVVDAIKNSETVQAQKEEIQAEGVRVLATIPQDYKETVKEVGSLKEDIGNHGVITDLVGDGLKLSFYLSNDRTSIDKYWNEEFQKNISADTTITLKYLGYTGQYLKYIRIDGKKSDGTYSPLKSLNNPVVGDELTVKTSFDLVGIRIQIARTQKEHNVSFSGTLIIYKYGLLKDVNAIKSDLNQTSPAKVYHVEKDGSGDFTRLVDAIEEAENYMGSVVYIGEGTWDLIEECGNDYIESISYTKRGIYLKNRIHLIGTSKTIIACHYTGDTIAVKTWLSAFNSGEYGFTIENLTIESSNCRYAIHDERDTSEDAYINKYINCTIKHDNTNGGYRQCIGGGLGKDGYIVIKDCIFESVTANNNSAVSYHNTWYKGGSGRSFIDVQGNYIKGKGTFRFAWFGDSTEITQIICANNSVGSEILFVQESTDTSLGVAVDIVNMELYKWNNEIRSN